MGSELSVLWERGVLVITSSRPGRTHREVALAAARAGAGGIQLRMKGVSDRELVAEARAIREICASCGIPFFVNDRVDVALLVGADGVHVGPEDLPLPQVRRLAGRMTVGFSAGSEEELREAEEGGADYVGVGPVRATRSKPDAGPPLGWDRFRELCRRSRLPVVAIGGIDPAAAERAVAAGARAVAVLSFVREAPAVEEAVEALLEAVARGRGR